MDALQLTLGYLLSIFDCPPIRSLAFRLLLAAFIFTRKDANRILRTHSFRLNNIIYSGNSFSASQ